MRTKSLAAPIFVNLSRAASPREDEAAVRVTRVEAVGGKQLFLCFRRFCVSSPAARRSRLRRGLRPRAQRPANMARCWPCSASAGAIQGGFVERVDGLLVRAGWRAGRSDDRAVVIATGYRASKMCTRPSAVVIARMSLFGSAIRLLYRFFAATVAVSA